MNPKARRMATIATVVLLSIVLGFASALALGIGHTHGDYWTYDMSSAVDVIGTEVDVSGQVTYTFEEQRSLILSGSDYDTNVLDIKGSLSGPIQLLGQTNASAVFVTNGIQYEDRKYTGVLERDLTLLGSVTYTAGPISFTDNIRYQENVTTVPSVLSGFDPASIRLGDSWTRTVTTTMTSTTWQNQVLVNTTIFTQPFTYDVQVASSLVQLETPAGTFDTVKITASAGGGDLEVFWWSSDVRNFVKQEVHENGSTVPSLSLNLTDHGFKSTGFGLLVPIIGVAMLAFAVIVLLVVFMRKKQPPEPTPDQDASPALVKYEPEASQTNSNR